MNNTPDLPSNLRAYAWTNRLVGFAVGVFVASCGWFLILATFRGPAL